MQLTTLPQKAVKILSLPALKQSAGCADTIRTPSTHIADHLDNRESLKANNAKCTSVWSKLLPLSAILLLIALFGGLETSVPLHTYQGITFSTYI